jgi:hypothetical protein
MPVSAFVRKLHGVVLEMRVVPQSQTKFRRVNSSTSSCSPWQDIEQE